MSSSPSRPAPVSPAAPKADPNSTDPLRQAALADPTLPEPVRRALEAGHHLERLSLDAEGGWRYQGDRIENPRICELFHRSIERTPGGTFILHIAPFSYPIEVADAPYEVARVTMASDAPESVLLLLSDGTEEQLDPTTLRYVTGRGLYTQVKRDRPCGPFTAHFSRPAYYALAEHIVPERAEGGERFVLSLGNRRFEIAGDSAAP